MVVERRSKKGRTFYGCANYPKCDFVSWDRVVPEPCPVCGSLRRRQERAAAASCTFECAADKDARRVIAGQARAREEPTDERELAEV